jgi:sec-independent protein translocase protein TatA
MISLGDQFVILVVVLLLTAVERKCERRKLLLEGFDLLIAVAFLAIIFLWGPGKLPQMARGIGQAKAEYDKVLKQATSLTDLKSITSSITNPQTVPAPQTLSGTAPAQDATASTIEDPIITAARSLGISTEGKTKEELAKEILTRSTSTNTNADEKERGFASEQ